MLLITENKIFKNLLEYDNASNNTLYKLLYKSISFLYLAHFVDNINITRLHIYSTHSEA